MSTVSLRKAQAGDEKILAHIQTTSWKAAFANILSPEELERATDLSKAEAMYRRVLAAGAVNLLIQTVDGQPHCIAGWSRNRCDLAQNIAELICIHSLPDKWHKGYGSQMMERLLEEMRQSGYEEVILWVFAENTRARRFYEKHGFTLTDRQNESHGAIELMYSKKL